MTIEQVDWVQVLATVGPMMLSGTAMIGGATWYLSGRIERLRAIASQVAELAPKVASLDSRMGQVEVRLTATEDRARERSEDEREFRAEMRTMVGSLLRGVSQT
jgi:outer membrane murein-binding lipoprotein Lpp